VAGFTRSHPYRRGLRPAKALIEAETVFWLISSVRPSTAPALAQADRVEFGRLLDALDGAGSTARVVVVSSGGTVYDPSGTPPFAEDHPTAPANAYGRAMLDVEDDLRRCIADHVVVRASNVYGPGQPARQGQGVIAHWLSSIGEGGPIRIFGDPKVRRDYVFIDDLAEALMRVTDHPTPPRLVNIGSGRGTSLAELADLVVATVGRPVPIDYQRGRAFDAPSTWLKVDRARQQLDWAPRTDLATGLAATWRGRGRH
jgi:UDP-glucose 4-epimerase